MKAIYMQRCTDRKTDEEFDVVSCINRPVDYQLEIQR